MQTDNDTACGIINDTVKQKWSKSMDMRFYWLRDHKCQGQFHIFWWPGTTNRADYYSKHHSPAHHQAVCPTYLLSSQPTQHALACVPDPACHPGEGVLIGHSALCCDHPCPRSPSPLVTYYIDQAACSNASHMYPSPTRTYMCLPVSALGVPRDHHFADSQQNLSIQVIRSQHSS